MPKKNFILVRIWQSKTGLQERLYLGYSEHGSISCIADRNKAKVMTYDECQDWLLVLTNRKQWNIERYEEFTEEVVQEENTNEQ